MMDRITVVVDTREQEPYSFDSDKVSAVRKALPAGDYSLVGLEERVAVERKSLTDFVSTVIRGRKRFHRELEKLSAYAKSKTGKSSAKRKLPEDDDTFQQRLQEKYLEPGMFHREVLYISRDQFEELRAELWELSKAMLDARRRDTFYRNTSYCFQYGRPCAYFQLCRSGGNPNVIENHFQRIAPHEELRDGAGEDAAPVF